MPLLLRTVEPVHVCRGTLPDRFPIQNDLEAVANGTLSNIIRQLSSLSHHAEELFVDLISVGREIAERASNLQARVDRLAVRVGLIDSVHDESSMQDSLHTKPFSSSLNFNQQVVSRASLPPAMEMKFQLCDKPPPLDKLNPYRDDGKDALKFYTDPSYFFDLWRQEMLKDTERAIDKNKKPHKVKTDGQNRHKKRVRQPHNTRERQRNIAMEQGELLMTPTGIIQEAPNSSPIDSRDYGRYQVDGRQVDMSPGVQFQTNNQLEYNRYMAGLEQYEAYRIATDSAESQRYGSPSYRNGKNIVNGYRPSQPPPAPPNPLNSSPNVGYNNGTPTSQRMSASSTPRNNSIEIQRVSRTALPPPPPLPNEENHVDSDGLFPPPIDEENHHEEIPSHMADDLPLPPPPDVPADDVFSNHIAPPPPPPPPNAQQAHRSNGDMNIVMTATNSYHKYVVRDGRSELLKAIREGIELRKVETRNDVRADEKPSNYHDVASILARRVAVEMSDSESGSSDGDSDGWDETSA